MLVQLTGPELIHLALRGELPPGVTNLEWADDVVRADVDLRDLPGGSTAARLAARAAGVIKLEARFTHFDAASQAISFALTAYTRGLSAHRLLNHVTGMLNAALHDAVIAKGAPDVVAVHRGEGEPVLTIAAGAALAHVTGGTPLAGAQLVSVAVAGGAIEVQLDLA